MRVPDNGNTVMRGNIVRKNRRDGTCDAAGGAGGDDYRLQPVCAERSEYKLQ